MRPELPPGPAAPPSRPAGVRSRAVAVFLFSPPAFPPGRPWAPGLFSPRVRHPWSSLSGRGLPCPHPVERSAPWPWAVSSKGRSWSPLRILAVSRARIVWGAPAGGRCVPHLQSWGLPYLAPLCQINVALFGGPSEQFLSSGFESCLLLSKEPQNLWLQRRTAASDSSAGCWLGPQLPHRAPLRVDSGAEFSSFLVSTHSPPPHVFKNY